ncbi:hypothetical protein PHMEG_00014098 [Phytophthora megakarya]|uniref:GAF domain-containing protein n=1 Tax=Phytophthora megakarya TaxID=4795 RepID=A0A225W789_9STRA|nr:hypothetical protein PHMEG_00014098 [Phytophthora megakarya]
MVERARTLHKREDFTSLATEPENLGVWKRVKTFNRFDIFQRQVAEKRARTLHKREDFTSLAAEPENLSAWKRVKTFDSFDIFQRQVAEKKNAIGLDLMCVGRVDASLEEISRVLRSRSEVEHNTAMAGLYAKDFIFGSYEREVSCDRDQPEQINDDDTIDETLEHLSVKTTSFARTALFARNAQWCYFSYFQRNKESDGFTISKRALPASEPTPGRIVEKNNRVDQLHGLNASYLVDKPSSGKGLRVVLRVWFDPHERDMELSRASTCSLSSTDQRSSFSLTKSLDSNDTLEYKAKLRRLMTVAHGITKLPGLISRRRFGIQIPVDLGAIRASNTRCPCCTRSLSHVKMSLTMAVSAIANRSRPSKKMDTRRCYLCGYLVCVECWSAEHIESKMGRVASIVACTRCTANIQACDYSEVFADSAEEHGPPRVVEDANNVSIVSLLIEFLTTSLITTTGTPEHSAVMRVIQTLLHQNDSDFEDDSSEDESECDNNIETTQESDVVVKVGQILSDEQQLPTLEDCKLGNSEQRTYLLDLPDNPTANVPHYPIPSDETERVAAAKANGLLELANCIAPETPTTDIPGPKPDTYDLQVLCQLAAQTLGYSHSFIAIMCAKHEHFLAENHPAIAGTMVPREHTTCQHALMSPYPFMVSHHEADVRFHNLDTTKLLRIRSYVGFPLTVPVEGNDTEVTVGMFCCLDSTPHRDITRRQYATMKRLSKIATSFLLQKARQLQQ